MRGTLTLPDRDGPFPAVVLVAGSGPTDRDWCSPLLPGTNGSGRLFAEAFEAAGLASLRYDKRASGTDAAESARALFGKLSMRSHLEELAAAVSVLTAHDAIDSTRLAELGNGEGALHVLHYVTSQQEVPFAGIVLAAPPGRPVGEVLLAQLEKQATQVPGRCELMSEVEAAAASNGSGEPMDLDPRLPDSVKMVLASFEVPADLPLARELWVESAADELPRAAECEHPHAHPHRPKGYAGRRHRRRRPARAGGGWEEQRHLRLPGERQPRVQGRHPHPD